MNIILLNGNDVHYVSDKIKWNNNTNKYTDYILCSETNCICNRNMHVYYQDKLYIVLSLLNGTIIHDNNKKIFLAQKFKCLKDTIQITNINYNHEIIDIIFPEKMLKKHKTLWKAKKHDIYKYFFKSYFDKNNSTAVETFLKRIDEFLLINKLKWSPYILNKIYKYVCKTCPLKETIIRSHFLKTESYTNDQLYTYIKPEDGIQIDFTCTMTNNILHLKIELIDIKIYMHQVLITDDDDIIVFNPMNYGEWEWEDVNHEGVIVEQSTDIFNSINKFISYILQHSFDDVNIRDINLLIIDNYVDESDKYLHSIFIFQDQSLTIIKNPSYFKIKHDDIKAEINIIENEHQIKRHVTLINISKDKILLHDPIILLTTANSLTIQIYFTDLFNKNRVVFDIECGDFNFETSYVIINQIMLDYSSKLKDVIDYMMYYINCVKKIQKRIKQSISNPNTLFGYNVIKRTLFENCSNIV